MEDFNLKKYLTENKLLVEQEEKEFKESILHLEEKIKNFKNNLY